MSSDKTRDFNRMAARLMLAVVENLRRKQLAWFDAVLLHRNWNMSQLAEAAKLDASTLSKFRNDPANTKQLSTRTVAAIEEASGLPAYQTILPSRPRGLSEAEAEPLGLPSSASPLQAMIAAAKGGRNGVDPWVLQSRALENAGYLVGDVLLVDQNAEPMSGDIVLAQNLSDPGNPRSMFRILEDTYLVAASNDPTLLRPWHVGRDPVLLRGVVVNTLRNRRAA